jgi:hypothetical protein
LKLWERRSQVLRSCRATGVFMGIDASTPGAGIAA